MPMPSPETHACPIMHRRAQGAAQCCLIQLVELALMYELPMAVRSFRRAARVLLHFVVQVADPPGQQTSAGA